MEIKCPVCDNTIEIDNSSICARCGFEVKLRLSPLPTQLQQLEDERIQIAKNRYDSIKNQMAQQIKLESKNSELQQQVAELNKTINELQDRLNQANTKKNQVPFFLMQVDINKTYQLLPIEEGRTSFGSYVAAQEANCAFHHCISPEMDATQFIITCEPTTEKRYRLTLLNNSTKPMLINGRPLGKSCPVMPPDVFEIGEYQFILLRP